MAHRYSYLVWALVLLATVSPRTADAQTPSPLQEWQYPGGIILDKLFEGTVPQWLRIAGIGASVEPIYDGSHVYHGSDGPFVTCVTAMDARYYTGTHAAHH